MKLRFFSLLLIGLMAAGAFAATIDQWKQDPAGHYYALSGNWNDTTKWKTGTRLGFPNTYATGDEFKLNTPYAETTIDDLRTYANRVTVSGGTASNFSQHTVLIKSGANATFTEMRVGHGNSSSQGVDGKVIQSSGSTLNLSALQVGYAGSRGACKGIYRITGGSLQATGGSGRIQIGAGMSSMATTANNEGVLMIEGSGAAINAKDLYVGGYSTYVGTGTISFTILDNGGTSGGTSKIVVSNGITLPAAGVANLNVTTQVAVSGPIILVENTGASAVSGVFDTLNGVAGATEGTWTTVGGVPYYITYIYDAATNTLGTGNDIALIPEPATIALLSLGLFAIRRKK